VSDSPPPETPDSKVGTPEEYWKTNIKIVLSLLSVWFIVSFGCGILFVEELNEYTIGGFKLGFWFAQQGSMIIFVILIVIYINLMNKLDVKYNVDEK
jgi:putative solute:sodium symporter small subunit